MSANKKIIESLVTKKEFSYSKSNVSLKFTLTVDDTSELQPFKDLLEKATADIAQLLEEMK